jgi:hypothetical protein
VTVGTAGTVTGGTVGTGGSVTVGTGGTVTVGTGGKTPPSAIPGVATISTSPNTTTVTRLILDPTHP